MPKTAATFGLEVFAAGCGCAVADSTFHPLETFKLATYDTAKRSFKERLGFAEGVPLHVCCSLLSGFVAQLVIQPVDTVKTLVMDSSSAESSPARFARRANAAYFKIMASSAEKKTNQHAIIVRK
ncbi:thiosulfate transmembrane transporter [Aureococcus anophagefferens]|nr:thiosulfate transmembrane transporter [Aureococcus anophagefferens]